ncbi:unnamed protein product [Bursaphelenchus xylophilus]|uniref:(pine wood nematode) hypothetical protein n=1 Tax=Bursaphelenchus xylophilus TaxID=6326 RepID=A0A1I7S7G7_BURXY|nr:unnamed protein product [Bursaphelenchus xylophilus]CAG9085075.1 unnamed protein product [Bursaphelenchus xylophilus]
MPFYCYQCEQTVEADQSLHCSRCNGEFIEEITPANNTYLGNLQPTISFVVGSDRQEPTNLQGVPPFLRNLLGAAAGPSSRGVFTPDSSLNSNLRHEEPARRSPNNRAVNDGDHSRNPQAQPGDFLGQFLNQLMANLSSGVPQGGHIHIQIGHGDGGGMPRNLGDYAFGDANFDEIITQLLNGYEQSVGLSKAEIKRLPMTNVTQIHVDNGTQCTTCMDTFDLGQEVAQLDCKHIYHKDCLVPWLERQKTCPICRQPIDPSKWPEVEDARIITDVDELD